VKSRGVTLFALPALLLMFCTVFAVAEQHPPAAAPQPIWQRVSDPCFGAVRNASIAYDQYDNRHIAIVCNNSEVFVR
jgi:hypothetical protein